MPDGGGVAISQPADPDAPNDNPAPGVNDDGSGVSLTLELARLFSQSGIDFDATLVFMCHVAEEQGLMGAKLHAQKAQKEGIPIEAVFNNDIVGGAVGGNGITDGSSIRVYSEGPEDSPSRELARFIQRWAFRYVPSHTVRPMARSDRFARGGDHSAYNQYGFPAVGFRESRENFVRQHDPRDTFEGVSPAYLAQNARVNAAAAATLALAPPPPVVVDGRGQPTIDKDAVRLRRSPSMGGRAGCDGVPHLLARGLGTGLAARTAGRQRDRVRAAEHPHRRSRVRRRVGRRRRPRELRVGLRQPRPRQQRRQDSALRTTESTEITEAHPVA